MNSKTDTNCTISLRVLLLAGLLATLATTACSKRKSSSSDSGSQTTTTLPNLIDITKIVSTGPSLSFNDQTAGVNSMAVNPVTHQPALVYYDKNASVSLTTATGALKYAFMDSGGAWSVEVVDANYGSAACGTANSFCLGAPNAAGGSVAQILDLAFKSDGTPAIAYVYGASAATASAFKQIRFAERSSSGVWTTTLAFQSSTAALATNVSTTATVDPMKGVSLVFDSSDHPHIIFSFYAQTLTNSKVKYLFRDSSGNWSSADAGVALSGSGAIAALGQGTNQGGMVYCPTAGPIATAFEVTGAAGAGRPLYLRCSALATNGSCSTWSSVALTTGCSGAACFSSGITSTSNAGTRTDIVLEPTSTKPIVAVYSTATPATSLLTARLPAACATAPGTAASSWGAMQTLGSASQGVNGFKISASDTETYAFYSVSTTSVAVNKCTTSSCSWLGTPTTVETTTVAAEGVDSAYDASSATIYGSYAKLPAAAAGAAGNDIILASGLPSDVVSAGSLSFALTLVDNLVSVFPSAAIPTLTAATAASGAVGFAYFYQDTTAADMKLYYGIKGGSANAPLFASQFVTSHQESAAGQFVGAYPSLAFDSNSNPAIAYYNGVNQNLELAQSSNGGVSFSIVNVDDHTSNNLGQYPSAAFTGNTLGIAYYDATNTGLKFARSNNNGHWDHFAVDGMAGTGSCGNATTDAGKFAKLVFTSTGRPVIAYQSDTSLKIAYAPEAPTSATYTWSCITLDSSGNTRGAGIDMVLTAANILHLVHFDATSGSVRYVTCASDIATCMSDGTLFSASLVNAAGTTTTISTRPAIQVTSTGTIYISYYSAAFQGLALTTRTSADVDWSHTEYLDTPTSGNTFTSLAGQYANLLLNASERPLMFYRSKENWIKYFSRELAP